MDPTWEFIRKVEQIAQWETPLTFANNLHKTVMKRLTRKLSAQVLTFLSPQSESLVRIMWIDTLTITAKLSLFLT